MRIDFSERFTTQLQIVLEFIAKDSLINALKFENELLSKIEKLDFMPHKYRKSIYFNNPNIRDFVFKGYVVPYLVDDANDTLAILGICKQNLLETE